MSLKAIVSVKCTLTFCITEIQYINIHNTIMYRVFEKIIVKSKLEIFIEQHVHII